MPVGISTFARLLLTICGFKASLFAGLPLKVTPQQKNNLTMTGSRLLNHTVHLTLHSIDWKIIKRRT
ncbi:hypothetical protein [Xenorhabdus bovienii]|uniref:hypothetical protein n=1 Tax=Xenorhabdus bovienii TaxID=40576 RepID=UPI0023B29FFB|nr:hypothetical protein [Xenorhabdus bovienii]MDE9457926.1 hypothetical protein [Xenorhabdus bovienii]MDE9486193.1 hypothetical protein [Xenorhabdus bovienii]MDE9513992.1 hypothetical protein [Xenorhabdus bovienii]